MDSDEMFEKMLSAYEQAPANVVVVEHSNSNNNNNNNTKRTRMMVGEEKKINCTITPTQLASALEDTSIKILVIVPAGGNSLHLQWKHSNADVCIVWYDEKQEPSEQVMSECKYFYKMTGPKWVLVRYAISRLNQEEEANLDIISRYDYVWLPDDDVQFVTGDILTTCAVMKHFNLHLAQPSLIDKNITNPTYRPILVNIPDAIYHVTNFVEIMAPCFSKTGFESIFAKTINKNECKSGWGMDSVWPFLLPENSVGVIDLVTLEHTRPPNAYKVNNSVSSSSSSYKEDMDPRSEEYEILKKFSIPLFYKKIINIYKLL